MFRGNSLGKLSKNPIDIGDFHGFLLGTAKVSELLRLKNGVLSRWII